MAGFITRIELHEAEGSDYDILHKAMGDKGFSNIIQDSNTKQNYYLPRGVYYYEQKNATKHTVYTKATNAVLKTEKDSSIVVVLSGGTKFGGLEKVEK